MIGLAFSWLRDTDVGDPKYVPVAPKNGKNTKFGFFSMWNLLECSPEAWNCFYHLWISQKNLDPDPHSGSGSDPHIDLHSSWICINFGSPCSRPGIPGPAAIKLLKIDVISTFQKRY